MNIQNEQWNKWEPIAGLSGRYALDRIEDGAEFKILLSNPFHDGKKLQVIFGGGIRAYRCIATSLQPDLMRTLQENALDDWAFFEVVHATYVKWLHDESFGLIPEVPDNHLSFVTTNFTIDVFSSADNEDLTFKWI